jgi:secreted trypsin-like serine protease
MRHRLRVIAAAAAVSIAAAGYVVTSTVPASAVAHGEDVPSGQYRFAAQLTMTGIPTPDGGRRNSACSGALVDPEWVITAGHCFRDVSGTRVEHPVADTTTATVGRANLSDADGFVRTVVAVRQFPTGDIALARLDRPVPIRGLKLPDARPSVGDVVRLAGFGWDGVGVPAPGRQLRTGLFTVSSVADRTVGVVAKAPQVDTSACVYDSGAPYFREGRHGQQFLVAVESTGPTCPHSQ